MNEYREKAELCEKYTKLPLKKIRSILKHDLYLTAAQCIKYGLADEILERQAIAL